MLKKSPLPLSNGIVAAAVPQGYPQADSAKFMSVGMGLPGFGMGGQAPPPALPQGQSGQAFLGNPGTAAAAFRHRL